MQKASYKLTAKLTAIVLTALLVCAFCFSARPSWATSADPLVSRSWVDQYVDAQFDRLDNQVASLRTSLQSLQSRHIVLRLGEQTALVNDQQYLLDALPLVKNNFIMVPMRFIGEALGISVNWNNQNKSVVCSSGNASLVLPLNGQTATVNGQAVQLDCPPLVQNKRVMVPTRLIAQSFGATVNWHQDTKSVDIYK